MNANQRRMIILKLASSELFCLDSVVSGTKLMIFLESIFKHSIAASFAFKQKRSLQLSVQPTLRFLVSRYSNNFWPTALIIYTNHIGQFLGSNGTELSLHFIFLAIL